MIEELKELVGLINELPSIALWILAGFAIYKTFVFSSVTASIYYGCRYLIEKTHDYHTRPKVRVWSLGSDCRNALMEGAKVSLNNAMSSKLNEISFSRENSIYNFLHLSDVQPLINHINEFKVEKE